MAAGCSVDVGGGNVAVGEEAVGVRAPAKAHTWSKGMTGGWAPPLGLPSPQAQPSTSPSWTLWPLAPNGEYRQDPSPK